MNLLLDTHVLLWWLADGPELSAEARQLIASPDNMVFVSAATAWEIAIERALGKLEAPAQLAQALQESGFEPLLINLEHAELAGQLPRHHDDPFDRMLVAQARVEGLTLVSRDERVAKYDVRVVKA